MERTIICHKCNDYMVYNNRTGLWHCDCGNCSYDGDIL